LDVPRIKGDGVNASRSNTSSLADEKFAIERAPTLRPLNRLNKVRRPNGGLTNSTYQGYSRLRRSHQEAGKPTFTTIYWLGAASCVRGGAAKEKKDVSASFLTCTSIVDRLMPATAKKKHGLLTHRATSRSLDY
jgi:hypothetical protein